MPRTLLLVSGLALMALLAFFCLRNHAPAIEADISQRASQTLTAKNFDWATAKVSGRDVTLNGIAPDPSSRTAAELAITKLDGVRTVDNQLTVIQSSGAHLDIAPAEAGKVVLDYDGQHLALSGKVADDAAHQAITQAAAAVIGAENLVDELQPNSLTPGSWTGILADTLIPQLKGFESAHITLKDNRIHIEGYISRGEENARIEQALRDGLPRGYTLDYNVVSPEAGLPEQQATTTETSEPAADEDTASGNSPTVATAEPPAAPVARQCETQLKDLLANNKIHFATASTAISEDSLPLLKDIADTLAGCPRVHMEIAGHTDTRGRAEMNQRLSQGRAESVRHALVELGVPAARLSAKGYGESQPLTQERNAEELAQNRRIEFHALITETHTNKNNHDDQE